MPDKKPTDSEIVKALECRILTGLRKINKCGKCKYVKSDACNIRGLITDALDLINRQNEQLKANFDSRQTNECENIGVARFEAEINRLQEEIARKDKIYIDLLKTSSERADIISSLQAENERLKKEKDEYAYLYEKHINTAFSHIKAEAYKECIEKVKEEINKHSYGVLHKIVINYKIDNLLKEMVGEEI